MKKMNFEKKPKNIVQLDEEIMNGKYFNDIKPPMQTGEIQFKEMDITPLKGKVPPNMPVEKIYLWKTELCRSWMEKKTCKYGDKCQFAHGSNELRPVVRHPKYKTEICKDFRDSGFCPFGKRCRFLHNEERTNLVNNIYNIFRKDSGSKLPFFTKFRTSK